LLGVELPIISQAEMLCRVAEAKFEAEREPTVGKDSAVGVLKRPTGKTQPVSEAFISIPAMQAIRALHVQHKDRPYPQRLLDQLMDEVNSEVTSEHMRKVFIKALELIRKDNKRRRAKQRMIKWP
jgi:hypothetical protein